MAGPEGRPLAARAAATEHRSTRRQGLAGRDPAGVALAAEELLPTLPTPATRDLSLFLGSDVGQTFMSGNWVWFAILFASFLFNTVLGEELLFRGLLLPRMQGVFGRWDWAGNGVLFALYHLHVPWVIPQTFVDTRRALRGQALPERAGRHRRPQRPERLLHRPDARPGAPLDVVAGPPHREPSRTFAGGLSAIRGGSCVSSTLVASARVRRFPFEAETHCR